MPGAKPVAVRIGIVHRFESRTITPLKLPFARLCGHIISGCWLLCGQQSSAQGSFISYTRLENPNPGGIFDQEFGAPVYNNGPGSPSTLPVDLNNDGVAEYQIIATGTTSGFQMEGSSLNAVWSRPTGGSDIGAFIVPLAFGTGIGGTLPSSDRWTITEQGPFGAIAPGFSAYSTIGPLGLFVDQTAFAGLQFSIDDDVYYGWIKVQEIPFLQGGGIVYEYAYDTRPNMPIMAGGVLNHPRGHSWLLD